MSQFFTPTMIIENTQLSKVVSLLKGPEWCFNTEDEKINFFISIIWFIIFSYVKVKGFPWLLIYQAGKSIFSSSALKQRSSPFRSATTWLNCVFSIIIVGVKKWLILKKSIFLNFYQVFIDFEGSSKRLIFVEWCMKIIFERLKKSENVVLPSPKSRILWISISAVCEYILGI